MYGTRNVPSHGWCRMVAVTVHTELRFPGTLAYLEAMVCESVFTYIENAQKQSQEVLNNG